MSGPPKAIAGSGRTYWRQIEELSHSPSFAEDLRKALPQHAAAAESALDRRRFLQLAAASAALGGLTACDAQAPAEKLIPYVHAPLGQVAGQGRTFASTVTRRGYGEGVLLLHQMSRPLKVEGNPEHPASLGATDATTQAMILDLYDPERSRTVMNGGSRVRTMDAFVAALTERAAGLGEGAGLRLLSGPLTSPTFAVQLAELRRRFPALTWHRWDAAPEDNRREGARLAFGRPLDLLPKVEAADVLVAIDSDLFEEAPGRLAHARAFARRRRAAEEKRGAMNRVYAIESTPTLIGAKADHRFPRSPAEIAGDVRALASLVGVAPGAWAAAAPPWLAAMARDLLAHKGSALLHAGPSLPAAETALVQAINEALGASGRTLTLIEPVELEPVGMLASLASLVSDMRAGKVDTLLILGGNPAFTAPADLGFPAALRQVPFSVHLGQDVNETAISALWHIPEAHPFEIWSDARAFDGTVSLIQPQVQPLYDGWSMHELLQVLGGQPRPNGYALVRDFWQNAVGADGRPNGPDFFTAALRSGVVAGTASPAVIQTVRPDLAATLPATAPQPPKSPPAGTAAPTLTALFRPDPWLEDGRFANNGWLLELPRPLTRLTWDNAALLAPATAARLGLADGDLVELAFGEARINAPVAVLPGQAESCVTLPYGFGRKVVGRVGAGSGFDAFALRTSGGLWSTDGVAIVKLGPKRLLAGTQAKQTMEGRDIVREGKVADFLADPDFLGRDPENPSLYPAWKYDGYAWAMSINLNSCIGCGACVAACQAENNIPVVGREEVDRGRAMHWIRVDRYYSGPADDPDIAFQPVPCMHCEDAPCEVVCPVEATVHDSDGLNVMVYNRCVGTRFCSNNCPYKVRRFNFFAYAEKNSRLDMSWNPDVSVRNRGVMEKCTYCVQRIRNAEIEADKEDRPIRDGEVMTACQQVCPTEAIVFGNQNDAGSAVRARKASPLDYSLLADLNTRPRTTYGARLTNPNPDVPEGKKEEGSR